MKVEEIMPRPLLSVSIVLYRTPLEVLRATLDSLECATRTLSGVLVVVVDNDSGEAYRRDLREILDSLPRRPDYRLQLVEAAENRGYGAGHNLALASGVGEFHLVLNPDVEMSADSLAAGIAYLREAPDVSLLSPRALGGSGQQEFLCKRRPSVLVLAARAFFPRLGARLIPRRMADYEMRELATANTPRDVELASGCFMLLRGEQLLAVEGFDERYFLYFEDFDLSLRLSRLGHVRYHPGVRIVHHGGYAARKGLAHLRMFLASALRFFNQHGWRWI
ncbi:glycosyltransferase family 2 protein [Haliea sp. E17]|uniref:glycosyltransferase family 2 protein n=1 Tax=Haliea sp. E17 TaxID=3401576 RepID=UPI003AAA62AA